MKKKGTRRCLHQDTKSLITPSLHLCFFQDHNVHFHAGNWMSNVDVVLFALPNAFITNKQTNKQHVKAKQRCRDGVMSVIPHFPKVILDIFQAN